MTLEGDTLVHIQNCRMTYFLPYANTFQQTRSGRHANISHQIIMKYFSLTFYRKPILNLLKKNQIMKHSLDHSDFILLKMKIFLHPKHQNHMSSSLHALKFRMDLTLLFLLSFSWVLNLKELDPNIKIYWYPLALLKGKLSQNSTSELFRPKLKCFYCKMKQEK